jgi:hypothetical protein
VKAAACRESAEGEGLRPRQVHQRRWWGPRI